MHRSLALFSIANHMQRDVTAVSFGLPSDPLGDVVHQGKLFEKVAAADCRSEAIPPGPNLGSFLFLDARQADAGLGFLFGAKAA